MSKNDEFDVWIKIRPQVVQDLAAKFPINTVILHEGRELYLVGYNESGHLLVSVHDPVDEYELASTDYELVCPSCIEQLEPQNEPT